MNLEEIILKHQEIKAEVKLIEAENEERIKPYCEALQLLENAALLELQAQGLQNAKTPVGTAYLATQWRVSVKDKSAFFRHMQGDGDFSMLDIRAVKEPVKEFVRDHDGVAPPGVEISSWIECNIRKS